MLTPTDLTPQALADYATAIVERGTETKPTDDELRIVVLVKVLAELGEKIRMIQEILLDD